MSITPIERSAIGFTNSLSLTESETELHTQRVDLLKNVSLYFPNSTDKNPWLNTFRAYSGQIWNLFIVFSQCQCSFVPAQCHPLSRIL